VCVVLAGKVCQSLGDVVEAAATYRRAIELEEEGAEETDAFDLLTELLEEA
jgi:predicted RNA polymerase sigma factor